MDINGVKTGHDEQQITAPYFQTHNYGFSPMTTSANETQLSKIFAP